MRPFLILGLILAANLATADNIALPDGRIFRDAQIVGQSPTTVTIRHSGGFDQVEKRKLPDDLAAQYPVDDTEAARQRAEQQARAAQLARKQAQRTIQLKEQAAQNRVRAQHSTEARQAQAIKGAVSEYLKRHFGRARRQSAKAWSFAIPYYQFEEPVPVPGTLDRWTVAGTVEPSAGQPKQSFDATVAALQSGYQVLQCELR